MNAEEFAGFWFHENNLTSDSRLIKIEVSCTAALDIKCSVEWLISSVPGEWDDVEVLNPEIVHNLKEEVGDNQELRFDWHSGDRRTCPSFWSFQTAGAGVLDS